MIPIKNEREIEKMRQSCKTASAILDRVSSLLRPGITTREVDQAAADGLIAARPFASNAAFLTKLAELAPTVDQAAAESYLEAQ